MQIAADAALPASTDPKFLVESKFTKEAGLVPQLVYRNMSTPQLYELVSLAQLVRSRLRKVLTAECPMSQALAFEPGTYITSSGALATRSGKHLRH